MTPNLCPRGILRSALMLATVFAPLATTNDLLAQATKRAVTHDDYDKWPSLRSTTYSRDGKWMAYIVKPRVGDGVLHVREVDGDTVYTFDRGERVTFSNDNKLAMFKVGKSYSEERRKQAREAPQEGRRRRRRRCRVRGRGRRACHLTSRAAHRRARHDRSRWSKRMMEQRGATIAEVRGFLGLSERRRRRSPPRSPAKKGGRSKSEFRRQGGREGGNKALAKRLHILDLSTGEVSEDRERVKSHRQPK